MSRYRVQWAKLPSTGRSLRVIVDAETFELVPEARDFSMYLSGAGRADNTIASYIPKVAAFLNWADSTPLVEWRSVTLKELGRFKWSLEAPTRVRASGQDPATQSSTRSPKTVNLYLTAVLEFLRYCVRAELIAPEVVDRLVEPRFLAHVPKSFDPGERGQFRYRRVRQLRAKETKSRPSVLAPGQPEKAIDATLNPRDRFLIKLLEATGMRIGEVLGLRRSDMHFLPSSTTLGCEIAGPHLHVIRRTDNENGATAKSTRSRHIPVGDDVVRTYVDYQIERDRRVNVDSDYVFVNLYKGQIGAPFTYNAAVGLFRMLRRRAGIPDLHAHLFRHTRATAWIEEGTEHDVVQGLLGHALAASTAIYNHPSPARLRDAVERGRVGGLQ